MARVSVCVPTADRPSLLREALASIASQTYRDLEVLVSDNSRAPDNRALNQAIVREFPDLRIAYSEQPVPVDVVTNFNTLVETAQGDLWTCLPDDDRLCPQALSLAVDALERHPECGFTFADHHLMNSDGTLNPIESRRNSARFGRTELRQGVLRHEALFPIALRQSMCLQTMVFRRGVIRTFRFAPGVFMCDFSLQLRIAASSTPVHCYYIDDRVFAYRIHSAQVTTVMNTRSQIESSVIALKSVGDVPAPHKRQYDKRLSQQLAALAVAEAEVGEPGPARLHAMQSLKLSPGPRALTALLLARLPKLAPLARGLYRGLTDR